MLNAVKVLDEIIDKFQEEGKLEDFTPLVLINSLEEKFYGLKADISANDYESLIE